MVGTLLYWVSIYLYVPTLPSYLYDKTLSLAIVGSVLSMYGLWQAVVRVPIGVVVDATGRWRIVVLFGFGFAAAGSLLLAYGDSVASLTVGRGLTGIAAGTWVPLIAVFAGFFPRNQAVYATSLLTLASSIGRTIATSLNGFLNNLGGLRLSFILAAAAALLAAVSVGGIRSAGQRSNGVSLRSIRALFVRPNVVLPSVMSLVLQIATFALTFSFLPIHAESLGPNDIALGLLMSLNFAMLTAGNFVNTLVAKSIRHIRVIVAGPVLTAIGIVLLAVTRRLWVIFSATALMGIANGLTYPTLLRLSIRKVDQDHRSSSMGIHQSVYAIGMFTGPWLGGLVADAAGIRLMFVLAAVCVVLLSAVLIAVYSRHEATITGTQETTAGRGVAL